MASEPRFLALVHTSTPPVDMATVLPDKCLWPIDDDHLCLLPRKHKGQHLPLPRRWAQRDVGPDNPRYRPTHTQIQPGGAA